MLAEVLKDELGVRPEGGRPTFWEKTASSSTIIRLLYVGVGFFLEQL
jgi:hypothetical protein